MSDRLRQFSGLPLQVVRAIPLVLQVLLLGGAGIADHKRKRTVHERRSQGPGDGLHLGDAGNVEHRLGHPVQDQHVGRVAQVVIGLDHEQFGLQPGPRKMPLGGRVPDIGRRALRHVGAGVVTRLVSRQGQQAHQRQRARRHQNGAGPADDGRADPPPPASSHGALGFEDAHQCTQGEHGRSQGQRTGKRDEDAQRGRNAQALKVGQPGKAQTGHRSRDGQTRTQDDVGRSVKHCVEGLFAILTGAARFLVAADEKNRVVRSGGDHQQREQVCRVGRQPDDPGVAQKRHDSPGGGHFDEDRHEHQQRGEDGAVHEEQHQRDHPDGDRGDLCRALAAHVELIRDERRRASDIGLDTRRWLYVPNDVAHGADALVGLCRALIAREKHLNIRGLAVGTLRPRRGQGVPPEVLDVFDVLLVRLEPADHLVVELVRVRAERLVTLQHHHGRAVGVELMEVLTDPLDRLERRRIRRIQRHVVCFPDLFQLRHRDVREGGQRQPEQQDRQRKPADGVRYAGRPRVLFVVAHPDLSRQKV